MGKQFRITLWSGGKPALVHYTKESPKMLDGGVAFRTDDGNVIRVMGTISIEEGEFSEKRISGGPRQAGTTF